MRITDKILTSLRDYSQEQKSILSGKFVEQSKWLESELQSLKNLILQDPRENFQLNQVAKSTAVEDTDEIPAPSSSMPERNQAQKRKSPEVALTLVRDSPEQKRSTPNVEWENVATHFGIPSDLNKLKKEELLVMLEGYGIHSLSMKDYKKDLMDTLKSHLELEYCSSIRSGHDTQMFSEPLQSSEMVQSEPIRPQDASVEKAPAAFLLPPSSPIKANQPVPVVAAQEQSNQAVEVAQEIIPEPSHSNTHVIQEEGSNTHGEDALSVPMEELHEVVVPNPTVTSVIDTSTKPSSDQALVKKPSNLPIKSNFVDKPTVVSLFLKV